ncbi:TlpA disulfide reductase family protein [uncultured Croceitalea sp.]|uniref:TlpA disulfide reductase family protein n=1 Tax=uncultured Croceitalea sp. TaxID=1798908 RepID=UPI0033056C7D
MLRKLSLVVIVVSVMASCTSNTDGFVIDGTIDGELENGTKVFLKTTDSLSRSLIEVDTTTIENGTFKFVGASDEPIMHYLMIDNVQGNAPVIVENGTISFRAQKDSLAFSKVKGTAQNEMFMDYLDESRTISSMSRSMNEEFSNARMQRDSAVMNSLREEFMELQERAKTFELDFVKKNPSALISVLILDKVVSTKALPTNEIQELFDALTPEIKATIPGKRIKEQLDKLKTTEVGAVAPDFSAPTPSGEVLALNEIKGKVTLIDFWAAWCRPCRAENPNIVSVYEKYKDKGLQIVGVSLDRKAEDWTKAIQDDNLTWNHVSHLQYFQDPIAQMYGVNAIPAAFLIDENGVIIAKNLRGNALEQKVAELLN